MIRTYRPIGEPTSLNTLTKNVLAGQQSSGRTEINRPNSKRSNNLTHQDNQHTRQSQQLITNDDARQTNMEQRIGTISMQMPSLITRRRSLECLPSGSEMMTDRLSDRCGYSGSGSRKRLLGPRGIRFGSACMGRLGVKRNLTATFAVGLLYQIIIVSLILHKFPARGDPTRVTMVEAKLSSNAGDGIQTLGKPTGSAKNPHISSSSSPEYYQRRHNLIETPLIYTLATLILNGDLHERQLQHENRERQRQQPSPAAQLTGRLTKDVKYSDTTYAGGEQDSENNQRRLNQSGARSFMKSEIVDEDQLDGPMPSGTLVEEARERARATTTALSHRRSRRHTGLERANERQRPDDRLEGGGGDESEVSVGRHLALPTSEEAAATMAPDCKKLASLWLYLHSSYPLLASHIVEVGLGAKASQLSRTIIHLLESAERFLAGTRGILAGQRSPSTWLARVGSHPAYGRLVQHLRAKQLDKNNHFHGHSTQHQHRITQEAAGDALPVDGQDMAAASVSAESATELANVDGDQMSGSMKEMSPSREAAYGRIVHYPHEIESTDNSNGMARTRDKLRLLKHQQRQQQTVRSGGDTVDANKLPQSASPSEIERRKLAESAVNQARNNFVYGTVLMQPYSGDSDQVSDGNKNNHRQSTSFNYNKPISTLRELAHGRERLRLAQLNDRQLPLQLETNSRTAGNDQSPSFSSQRSYGHILTSPPNDNRGLRGSNTDNHDNIDKNEQSARQSEVTAVELTNQQAPGPASAEDGDSDEFEGVFHSSPLKQVEIRMLKSFDQQQQQHDREPHAIELASGSVSEPLRQSPDKSTLSDATEIVMD